MKINKMLIAVTAMLAVVLSGCKEDETVGIDASMPMPTDVAYDEVNSSNQSIGVIWDARQAISAGATSFTVQLVKTKDGVADMYDSSTSQTILTTVSPNNATTFSGLTAGRIYYIRIRANYPLEENRSATMEQARQMGAMALFGEKYGDKVRIVKFGDSVELCGGTHVKATGQIGFFKIISESAIAAGVRRIEATTGAAAETIVDQMENALRGAKALFNNAPDLAGAIRKLIEENSEFKKKFEEVRTPYQITEVHFKQENGGITAEVHTDCQGKKEVTYAPGNGRLNSVSNALKKCFGLQYNLVTYQEHALEASSSSRAIAYVGIQTPDGKLYWGAGVDSDIIRASIDALVTAINNSAAA